MSSSRSITDALESEALRRSVDIQAVRDSSASAASGGLGVWRNLIDFGVFNLAGLVQGTYLLVPGGPGAAVAAATDGSAGSMFYLNPSYNTVTGYTAKARLRTQAYTNATGAAATLTASIVLAGALTGANSPRVAIGAAPTPTMSSVAATAPAAGNKTAAGSAETDISAWTQTFYVVQLVVSGADMAAGSQVMLKAQLEVRNV